MNSVNFQGLDNFCIAELRLIFSGSGCYQSRFSECIQTIISHQRIRSEHAKKLGMKDFELGSTIEVYSFKTQQKPETAKYVYY